MNPSRVHLLKRVLVVLLGVELLGGAAAWALTRPPPAAPIEPLDVPLPSVRPAQVEEDAQRVGQGALRRRLPLSPGARDLTSIGEQLIAFGVPLNVASYQTDESGPDVLTFYARYFEAQGWAFFGPEATHHSVPVPALAATLPAEELELTVMVIEEPEGGCTVILGQADLGHLQPPQGDAPGDLPTYPGAAAFVMGASDVGRESITVTFETDARPEAVEAFYRKALSERGVSLEPADASALAGPLTRLKFKTDRHSWNLVLGRAGGQTTVSAIGAARLEEP